MEYTTEQYQQRIARQFEKFASLFNAGMHVLVVMHNFPDPDALASAAAFKYLAEELYKVKVSIGYGGNIGRAENKALLKRMKISLKQISRIKFSKYERIVVVDTQPGAGNNLIDTMRRYHLVVDHHPLRRDTKADIVIVEPGIGVTSSIFVECLRLSGLPVPMYLATALVYAISAETQNMKREAHDFDVRSYLYIYQFASVRQLSEIIHPKLPQTYFAALGRALNNAYIFRNLIYAPLNEVPNAEMVAEMCDFLLRRERIGWVLCTGKYKQNLYVSLRSSHKRANAGKIITKLVKNTRNVGGHEMSAGGFIPLPNNQKEYMTKLEEALAAQFGSLMGYESVVWKPLLDG
ncbi:MAG: DHH family phosphoesterase [Spirochaetia bacterium]